MNRVSQVAVVAVVAALMPFSAQAVLIAGDYVGGGTLSVFGSATGYFFTPTVDLVVTDLGYYDHGDPGLADSHAVGIFLANGTAVVNTSVASGTGAPFVAGTVAGTRFQSVTPTPLSAGTQYYIVADNNATDQYAFGAGAVVYAPQITWDGYGDSSTNSIFGLVELLGGVPGNLGPNFMYNDVPEPSTFALVISGMGLVFAFLRRR